MKCFYEKFQRKFVWKTYQFNYYTDLNPVVETLLLRYEIFEKLQLFFKHVRWHNFEVRGRETENGRNVLQV